ncbi:O-antigen ligase family protein [Pseudarthrobacter sp. alpha12b]
MGRFLGFIGAIALAVLTYGGQVKTLPGMGWIPIDLTLLTAAVTLGCSALLLFATRPGPRIFVVLGLWWFFLFPIFLLTPTPYGTQKVLTLFTFTLVSAIAPFFVLRTTQQRRVFLGALVILAVVVGIMSYQAGALDSLTGSAFADINPIGISRLMATGAVILLVLAFAKGIGTLRRLVMFAAASGLLMMIFASGRRGPVLAVVVGVVVALAFAPAFRKYRVRALVAGVTALVFAGWYSIQDGSAGAERVLSFLNGEQDASTAARNQIWDHAYSLLLQYPQGVGWGSFPRYADVSQFTNSDGRMYPHNLFLEGLVEGGWLVGAALLLFVVIAARRLLKNATTPQLATFLGLFAFALTNALVSGDVNDQKLMWVTLGLAFVLPVSDPVERVRVRALAPSVAAAKVAAERASKARGESLLGRPDDMSERPSMESSPSGRTRR